MKSLLAVYLRELLLLKNRGLKFIFSLSINPLLYIITFGYALGKHITIQGKPYIYFLIPGLIAATSMFQAFSINIEINISRFYLKTFEEIRASPISPLEYTLGEVLYGVTRSFLSTFIILFISWIFKINLNLSLVFWIFIFLNSFWFATAGLLSALLIKSHGDQNMINNFIITPMMFLSGTFFPVKNLPKMIQPLIKGLPLTITSQNLRSIALYGNYNLYDLFSLLFLCLITFLVCLYSVKKTEE